MNLVLFFILLVGFMGLLYLSSWYDRKGTRDFYYSIDPGEIFVLRDKETSREIERLVVLKREKGCFFCRVENLETKESYDITYKVDDFFRIYTCYELENP